MLLVAKYSSDLVGTFGSGALGGGGGGGAAAAVTGAGGGAEAADVGAGGADMGLNPPAGAAGPLPNVLRFPNMGSCAFQCPGSAARRSGAQRITLGPLPELFEQGLEHAQTGSLGP